MDPLGDQKHRFSLRKHSKTACGADAGEAEPEARGEAEPGYTQSKGRGYIDI